jgi:hypothetical protein
MSRYEPRALNTSTVELSSELLTLAEDLAKNMHAHWAEAKIDDGWTFGSQLDGEARTHPDLVPVAELSQEAWARDRAMAVEVLRAIIALGYRIERA